ncbi:hypothetical protein ACFVWR_06285 [Leifsonia sp. NPDC058292]|uniref:baeRF11 domain-containing protein n=1 Tax=Leifsonia sp. NPDC058292 TaxID=3346428 RepID=UPI0036DF078E
MEYKDIPTKADIERISALREPGAVSIYLPTGTTPPEADRARIELKNHLALAVRQLEEKGVPKERVASIRAEGEIILDDRDLWRYQSRSLAVFLNGEFSETFRLPNRLTSSCDIADRFYVKPLFRAVTFPQSAYIIALAGKSSRLIKVSAEEPATVVDVPNLPENVSDAVGPIAPPSRNGDIRHVGEEGQKVRMREYAQAVDRALRPLLASSTEPLILAASEPLLGIYPAVNTYQHLVDEVISGSPEEKSEEELAAAARHVLDTVYASKVAKLQDEFGSRIAAGTALADLSDIARAATFGAVETLIFDIDRRVPGTIDDESGAITLADDDEPGNYGVVDEIIRRSLASKAKVYALRAEDVPGGGAVAAAVRFPV